MFEDRIFCRTFSFFLSSADYKYTGLRIFSNFLFFNSDSDEQGYISIIRSDLKLDPKFDLILNEGNR